MKRWRKENKEHKQQYQKDYIQNNKDKISQYNKNRSHKNHKINNKEWESCLDYFNHECAYCGFTEEEHKEIFNEQLHKEHVDPNGANDLSNCVPSCRLCNSSKWEYSLDDWYNMNNIRFDADKYFKVKQWIEIDYKDFIYAQLEQCIKRDELELYAFDIHTVMKNENIEFVTGCMHIVKCTNGILKIQADTKWNDVYMTRSYLDGKYVRISDKGTVVINNNNFIVREKWETDWYSCSSCGFDSLTVGFDYCPHCGVNLEWQLEEDD